MLYFFMNLVDLVEIIAYIDHSLKSAVYDCNHFTPINKRSRQRFFGPAIPSNSLPSMAGGWGRCMGGGGARLDL